MSISISNIDNGSLQVKDKSYNFVSAKIKSRLSLSDIPYNILNDIYYPFYLASSIVLNETKIDINSI